MGEESSSKYKLPELPNGRTQEYYIFRCCERFGWCLDDFYKLDKSEQGKILAYEEIRQLEDAHQMQATMSVGLMNV